MFKTVWTAPITLLLVTLVLGGCGRSSFDQSLTPDEYVKAGISAWDAPWSATEMAAAATILTKIADTNPKQLPQYESPKSGALFARITSRENLDHFKDKTRPISVRFPEAAEFFQSSNQLLKVYTASFMKKSLGSSEVVELIGMNLRASVAMLDLVGEFTPTLNKDDSTYFKSDGGNRACTSRPNVYDRKRVPNAFGQKPLPD
jgi:hypothetical protein